ncbi:discoidin domain-containing protein [Paenibacillus sp. FSL E2-0178]|uniref:discoidin domain-containing protein n=1 Tax=Paenibacillus sp. FSL E2-0178 TaxID=2921361 RepID=UPI00315891E5
MVVAIIVSLMTLGTPVIAGGDQGGTPTQLVVTYETNGGSTIAPQLVSASGGKLVFQYTPVKECFSFAGWYYDSALTQAYSGSDLITRNLTLYAKWAATGENMLCGATTLTPNLALNRPATVDSTCNASQTAAKAVEGSVINDSKWCSKSGNRWLQIDLGSVKQVNQFVIKHAAEGGETPSYNTKAYNIQVSTDGTNWSTVVKVTNNMKSVTVDNIASVSARYIKLNVTTPTQTTNPAARIYEFEVYGPPNLALNKPATVDSTCNASQTADKAVEGSVINDSKWCSKSGNRWLQIDLGSVKQVNQFVIKHASEGGETASYNTKAYNIQVSTDGTNWSTVVNVTNNTLGITVNNITVVSARYIKLNVTAPTQTTNPAARIFEFEVYGPGSI